MVAALVALGSNVGASVLGRSANRHGTHSPLVVTAVSMAVGSAVLLAVGVSVEGWPELSGRAAVILVWLAVVNTALAFTLWNVSLRRLSALESAGINNTMLIQIAALAWIFLGEEPGLLGVVGIVLVSVGVFFTQAIAAGSGPSRTGTEPRSEERLP
jgi:drug/metabolite transporter (DMT)-like permease